MSKVKMPEPHYEKDDIPSWGQIDQDCYTAAQMEAYADAKVREVLGQVAAQAIRDAQKLAAETLRADQGWERYEGANRKANLADKEIERLNVELLKVRDLLEAVENLIRQKGRHNTELAYNRLVSVFLDLTVL